jgi:AraC-like DNA-binding protein
MELDFHKRDMEPTFIERLTRITEQNLTNEHFSVDDLANAMDMTYTTLYRQLKSSTNKTISQFVREIRLKKANEILLQEDVTASEVAYRVGFGSPTYFNKCFHEYFGCTPGEFRKRELRNKRKRVRRFFATKKSLKNIAILLALLIITLLSFLFFTNHRNIENEENHSTFSKPSFTITLSVKYNFLLTYFSCSLQ